MNPETGAVTDFATGVGGPVDLKVGPDGALYYLARQAGHVGRISYATSQPPDIGLQPASRTVAVGQSVTFRVGATGSAPLAFQWRRNGSPIAGATGSSYTRTNVQLTDNGAFFDVVVSNAFGTATSNAAQLTVTAERGAYGEHHSAGERHDLCGRQRDQLRRHGQRRGGRRIASERLHLVGQLAPRQPHPSVRPARHRAPRPVRSRFP